MAVLRFDDEEFHRHLRSFEFQPELLPKSRLKIRPIKEPVTAAAAASLAFFHDRFRNEFQFDGLDSRQSCSVYNGLPDPVGKKLHELGHPSPFLYN
jgi:hypothetical protein